MKSKWLMVFLVTIFIFISWYTYQKVTDDTHEGRSIIPEEHEDIPMYEELKSRQHTYIIRGNKFDSIHSFYMEQLKQNDWELTYEEKRNEFFMTRWEKEGFNGELLVFAQYNEHEEETKVIFDKISVHKSSTQ
ncbi:hypothetical protein D7Z54_26455 [Salibacterium salarium]|uniref:Uncharacterized protein n=1 Tax=Salibacterium salarium TaxID=284579 RepID=A0A3R9QPC9_9BACI|nr:hypothetical protein [Salibacterium salarium]RSL30382.1 hypothetical protein D7Z54_26455 [Salibacterium salarium]